MLVFAFAGGGAREKFEYLYGKYKRLMLYKAYGVLGDAALAEDAVSEAFLRIYRNMDKVGDPDEARSASFVAIISRNCALTLLKRRGRLQTAPLNEELDAAQEFGDGGDATGALGGVAGAAGAAAAVSLEESVVAALSAQDILRLVDKLGEQDRDIFLLKYSRGFSHAEIARALSLTENNVTVRLHRAKKRLRQLVAEAGLV